MDLDSLAEEYVQNNPRTQEELVSNFAKENDEIYDRMKQARTCLREQEELQDKILAIKQKKMLNLTFEEKTFILPHLQEEIEREKNIDKNNKKKIQEIISEKLSNYDN